PASRTDGTMRLRGEGVLPRRVARTSLRPRGAVCSLWSVGANALATETNQRTPPKSRWRGHSSSASHGRRAVITTDSTRRYDTGTGQLFPAVLRPSPCVSLLHVAAF